MCDDKSSDKLSELKAVYKLAIETRNFEIQQLINRNNFFMLFQGVLLAAVFSNQASKPFVEFVICFAGIIISWHQVGVAAGAKYWQEWWELKASEIEKQLKDSIGEKGFISLFNLDHTDQDNQRSKVMLKVNKQSGWVETIVNSLILKKYSVSRVPIRSGLILMVTWIILFLSTIHWSSFTNCFENFKFLDGHYFTPDQKK
ncbi:RipA family octameric membrane protein [Acinetobacter nosocomialis]|uniref:RipA family octameric membrane protein n=1 Tax=Acinetobacter nosocomialis TaxID=106654 RepID=UPI0025A95726|nr:hypothetical protein [Acinetobacter nosocomialis]MDM9639300.1 hypothetical protein [Acinetobacter nosocomialis]